MGKMDSEKIAIIGLATCLPGANSKWVFWNNLCAGVDSTGKFPISRINKLKPFINASGIENYEYKKGGFLQNIDAFDYNFFKIPKIEAVYMHPAQRIFLQNAVSALEDAGYGGNKWRGENIGVYVGSIGQMEVTGYQHITKKIHSKVSPTGIFSSGIAGRLSYFMDFRGESVVLDSACSSSFAALKYACNSLKNKECKGAVVGGVQLNIFPDKMEYSIGVESEDGHTRSFDIDATGTGISEGVCTIIIKRLEDAIRDNDHIYAVIRNIISNQDGHSLGIAAPNPKAQVNLIERLLDESTLKDFDYLYLELHGTGTKLGDQVEIKAISDTLERLRKRFKDQISIGSVKANIGHTFACSGLASLAKCCLMMRNRMICHQINFSKTSYSNSVNELINTDKVGILEDQLNIACSISNFGLSGTNYMCLLSDYKYGQLIDKKKKIFQKELFVLSAITETALRRGIEHMLLFLIGNRDMDLANMCYTLATGRGHYNYRLAIVCESIDELILKLKQFSFYSIPEKNIYYSYTRKLTDPRQNLKFGEIGNLEIENANRVLERRSSDSVDFLFFVSAYISGFDINWDLMYKNRQLHKVSLPTYNFDKIKCWPEREEQ